MTKQLKSLFKNQDLLTQALTHRSWVNEHPKQRQTNERLEFLGDAVLEFLVSKKIFAEFPDKEEGYLTALRANLVNTVNLSLVAKSLELGKKIYLSKGEEDTGGRVNQSLLADTFEAVVGALYLDSGIEACERFCDEVLLSDLEEKLSQPLKDPKSTLQELVQAKGLSAPKYEVQSEIGPDHAKTFTLHVIIGGKKYARGEGKSKSEAAQTAAQEALKTFS